MSIFNDPTFLFCLSECADDAARARLREDWSAHCSDCDNERRFQDGEDVDMGYVNTEADQ